jgi:hypothetical protein
MECAFSKMCRHSSDLPERSTVLMYLNLVRRKKHTFPQGYTIYMYLLPLALSQLARLSRNFLYDTPVLYPHLSMQDGCAKRTHCELDYLFDIVHAWCTYPGDVECGTRPSPSTTSTTKRTTTSDCGHFLDCRGMADGFYGDPYNCR